MFFLGYSIPTWPQMKILFEKSDVRRKLSTVQAGSCYDSGTMGRLFSTGGRISDPNTYTCDIGGKHPRRKGFRCLPAHLVPEASSFNSLSKLSFYFNMKVLI